MGGMLAAEVAALDTRRAKKLVLVGAAGFWLENDPIPDLFSTDLDDLPAMLFHDPKSPLAQMMIAMPWDDQELLTAMYVERTRRFSAASKFLWPIPDRGLKKRAYRIAAPTLLLWGASDKVIPPAYAQRVPEAHPQQPRAHDQGSRTHGDVRAAGRVRQGGDGVLEELARHFDMATQTGAASPGASPVFLAQLFLLRARRLACFIPRGSLSCFIPRGGLASTCAARLNRGRATRGAESCRWEFWAAPPGTRLDAAPCRARSRRARRRGFPRPARLTPHSPRAARRNL